MATNTIEIIKGDITTLEVDAIVNAANTSLLGGSGVDGAIHRAAGKELYLECLMLNGCKRGQAKITGAYKLPAKDIIHTVGPVWRGGNDGEPEVLQSCYTSCFKIALGKQIRTIAFPAISCGIYGYPVREAAHIAIREASKALEAGPVPEKVFFVCFDDVIHAAYVRALSETNDSPTR